MGGGGDPRGGPDLGGFNWQYRASIDPQELFRRIFGDSPYGFEEFAESKFGFGQAEEVYIYIDAHACTHGSGR